MKILEDSQVYHSESDSPSGSQVRKTILHIRMRGEWVGSFDGILERLKE